MTQEPADAKFSFVDGKCQLLFTGFVCNGED